MVAVDGIRIEGLREFQAALREMDGESQKQLRVALNEAAEIVAAAARRKVPTRSGKARQSVKASSSQREARVQGGSARVPYYGWLDYGGKVGPKRSVLRPFKRQGRYLYPAFHSEEDQVQTALEDALVALVRGAGLDVT